MTDNQIPHPIPAEETTSPRRDALAHVANSPNRVPVAIALMLAGAALLGGFVGAGLAGGASEDCSRALDAAEDQQAIFTETLNLAASALGSEIRMATAADQINAKAAPMQIARSQFALYSDKCRG